MRTRNQGDEAARGLAVGCGAARGQRLFLDRLCLLIAGKDITEGPKKFSLLRPICDGKDDLEECATVVVFQSPTEIHSSAMGIVAKCTAAPRAQHKRGVPIRAGDGEHAMNPLL